MIPNRSQVNGFNFGSLDQAASHATTIGTGIQQDADRVSHTISGLDWSGGARGAADDRASREHTQLSRVAHAFDDLSDAAKSGNAAMSHISDALKQNANGLEADMFKVSDDWGVTDTYNYALADAVAAANNDPVAQQQIAELKAKRAEEAKTGATRLKRLAQEFDEADEKCTSQIKSANEAISSLAPVASGLSSKGADSIADALNGGHPLSPSQLSQLKAATNLTPDQIDALKHGKPANLSQGQYDFIKELTHGMDGKSIDQITGMGAGPSHGAVQNGLANATVMMGTPNVGTAAGDHGGMGALPQNLQSILTKNMATGKSDPTGFFKFSNFIGKSNPELRQGSDVSRGILKQASEISGYAKNDPVANFAHPPDWQNSGEVLNHELNQALNVGASDKIATHDFITGKNMDVTCSDGGHFNANTHLTDLTTHHWEDQTSGVDKMFKWVGQDAASPDHFSADLAHDAANSLGHHLGSEANIGANQQLGVINPEMSKTLATAVSPYLGNFAGAGGLPGIPDMHIGHMQQGELQNMFQALNSSPESAKIINTAGQHWMNYMSYQYGMHPDSNLAMNAGQIGGAMTGGYHNEWNYLNDQIYHQHMQDYQDNMNSYKAISDAVGMVPWAGGPANMAADGAGLPDALFGPQPTPNDVHPNMGNFDPRDFTNSEVLKASQYIGILHAHGQPIPDGWLTNGQLNMDKIHSDRWFQGYMNPNYNYMVWRSTLGQGAGLPPSELPAPPPPTHVPTTITPRPKG